MKTWQNLRDGRMEWEQYWKREKVIDGVRNFFKTRGFHEAYTPVMVPIPSCEPNLEVFSTQLQTGDGNKRTGYLIMSPEYALKKMLAAGSGNIFEITRAFRNSETVSSWHNPEFCMLEWYRVGETYEKIMEDCEEMMCDIFSQMATKVDLSEWEYLGKKYDLTRPWPRLSVAKAFENYCEIDAETLLDKDKLVEKARHKGYQVEEKTRWDEVFSQIFFNEIEPKLRDSGKPCFVYDYPLAAASLSKKCDNDPRFAQRFELFLAGVELGNCFSELTDAMEQRKRFEKEMEERKQSGKSIFGIDEDLLEALQTMPESAGIAMGLDRVIMLATGVESVQETMVFGGKELFAL